MKRICMILGATVVLTGTGPLQGENVKQVTKPQALFILDQKMQTGVQPEFLLIPEEEEILDFPEAIAEGETDLDVLEEYYRNVATAYRDFATRQKEKAGQALERMKDHHRQLVWNQIRSGANPWSEKASFIRRARTQSINYHKESYLPSYFRAAASAVQKADFYEHMADMCGEICQEIKEQEAKTLKASAQAE